MKRNIYAILLVALLTACASIPEPPVPSATAVLPSATVVYTSTPEPTPTPTPEPYLLDEGILMDWDEDSVDYIVVGEGIESIDTLPDGSLIAVDDIGSLLFAFIQDTWIETTSPIGSENHVQMIVPDRFVSIVNDQGKVEEVLESGTRVLVNPDTGKYDYEFMNGQWEEYKPRVRIVGEVSFKDSPIGFTEVPKEIVETAVETVRNATLFTRNGVEIKTGFDNILGEFKQANNNTYIPWYGVLCGSTVSNTTAGNINLIAGFMGVELNSGDVMVITALFYRYDSYDFSYFSRIIDDSGMRRIINVYGELDITDADWAENILDSREGTPLWLATPKDVINDERQEGTDIAIEALKMGYLGNNGGVSGFYVNELGASKEFWEAIVVLD